MTQGPLVILSGPAGSGKSSVIGRLLAMGDLPLRLSVSATTRAPRPGEQDGVHYHFWTRERFERALQDKVFLESAQVHGNYYGTPRDEVEPYRASGFGVLLDIDVQGARQVRQACPDAFSIFLLAPAWEDYERRLRQRRTEDEPTIARRLETARKELQAVHEYDAVVVNDQLESAVALIRNKLSARFS